MINFFDIFGPSGVDAGEGMPHAGAAFMDAIASNESRGKWNVIYTPGKRQVQTFSDYSKHPRVFTKIPSGPNKGDYSSAAGKFQITASTYDRVAPLLGITDFSPASQVKIAWYLAQDDYKRLTGGGDLLSVLQSGDTNKILAAAKKLNGTWTSLPGGIEATHTGASFLKAFEEADAKGAGLIPKVGLNGELEDGTEQQMDVLSYVDYGRGPLAGRLPTDLKNLSKEAVARHDSIVKEVGALLDKGIVVPNGTRDLKNTASTVIDFPAADLIAAGVTSMGMSSIPADPKGPLPRPSPLAPWGDRPSVAGRLVAPGVIDVGTAPTRSSSQSSVTPTSTVQKSPVPGLKLPALLPPNQSSKNPANTVGTAKPLAPNVASKNPANTTGTPKVVPPPLSINDQKLVDMVRTMQARPAPSIEKTKGIAGTSELPRDYKPPAGIIPGTEPKPKPGALPALPPAPKASGNPANTVGAPKAAAPKPVQKAPTVPNPVQQATGAKTNAPVSLSNPVLQPIKTTPKSTPVTQTTTKPLPADVMKTVEKVLAEPAKPALPKGVVEAKPKSTAVPAWGAKVPAIGAPAVKPVTPAPVKPVTKVSAPLKKSTLIQAGSVVAKGAKSAPQKVLSPLDILGDVFLNGGAMTAGLIGDAFAGKKYDSQVQNRQQILKDMAAGKSVTVIDALRAKTGMSSSAAYDKVASSNNYGAGGFTSSGQSRTTPSGESWAANPSSGGGGPAGGYASGGR